MFVLKYLMNGLAEVLDIILLTYMIVIIARAVISWVNPDPYNKIVIFLYRITEPVLRPVRRLLPLRNVGIDFSPIIVILVIFFLQYFLVASIVELARHL